MKFSIKDFFSKCEQICSFLWICSHSLKKALVENFIFCAVHSTSKYFHTNFGTSRYAHSRYVIHYVRLPALWKKFPIDKRQIVSVIGFPIVNAFHQSVQQCSVSLCTKFIKTWKVLAFKRITCFNNCLKVV